MDKKIKTWEISGMGKGYEDICQATLWEALEWLKDKPKDIFKGTMDSREQSGIIRVTGVTVLPRTLAGLERKLSNKYHHSGASWQAAMGHARYIHEHGLAAWHNTMAKHRQEGPKEIDTKKMYQQAAKFLNLTPKRALALGIAQGKKIKQNQLDADVKRELK